MFAHKPLRHWLRSNQRAVKSLTEALKDESQNVRVKVAAALARIGVKHKV